MVQFIEVVYSNYFLKRYLHHGKFREGVTSDMSILKTRVFQ